MIWSIKIQYVGRGAPNTALLVRKDRKSRDQPFQNPVWGGGGNRILVPFHDIAKITTFGGSADHDVNIFRITGFSFFCFGGSADHDVNIFWITGFSWKKSCAEGVMWAKTLKNLVKMKMSCSAGQAISRRYGEAVTCTCPHQLHPHKKKQRPALLVIF